MSVTSWTVAPTYTCSRRRPREAPAGARGSGPASSARSAGSPRRRGRGRAARRGHGWRSASAASAGMMPSRAWARGQRGEDVEPALQSRALLEDRASARACPTGGRTARSRSGGCPRRLPLCGEGRQCLARSGPARLPTARPHEPSSTSMRVSSRQHLARIAPVPPGRFRGTDVDLLGALAVEPLVDLLGPLAADQRPRSGGRDVRPGSRWWHPRSIPRHRGTAGGSSPTGRDRASSVELDDVGHQLDRRQVLGEVQHPPGLVEQLRRVRAARPPEP